MRGVYPHYLQKAERKGRTKKEVDEIIYWLTDYDEKELKKQLDDKIDIENFFAKAPQLNPNVSHLMKLIQLLYAIEALARESGMSHAQRKALRIDKSLPIINEIGQYIYQQKNKVTPQSRIGKAFNYCSNRWVSLQNYLTNGMLEIDSNLIENSIRPLALGRKNYLFAG